MAAGYTTRLVDNAECAPGVHTFRFEKPEGYSFEPGQHLLLELETPEGTQAKPFTHAEAPADPYLEVTTRMTGSAFKNALAALSPGSEVRFEGPRGRRALPAGTARAAFLVGGVGITLARSVLRDADASRSGLESVLIYGNQDPSCVPYGQELEAMARAGRLTLVHVFVEAPPEWSGERGFITAELVRRWVDPAGGWHFVVVGPPAMVDAMDPVLSELGVPPERATVARFSGYG